MANTDSDPQDPCSAEEPQRPTDAPEADRRSTTIFGPPAGVVVGSLVAALVFAVILEFLVIISFIGQRLWADPRLTSDPVFVLPLLLWVAVAVAAVVAVVRILTTWLRVDENGFELRGLARSTVSGSWAEVGRVLAVRDIDRGATPAEMLDAPDTAYDGVYLLSPTGQRMIAVSSRFFGPRAQEALLHRAQEADVQIQYIEAVRPAELRRFAPEALGFGDRHPNLILAAVGLFYVVHNALTFTVWGL